ncbi:TonB-dependent receptor [Sandarakinorhabdus cyanobacteriorum]|uniref:TonB-dependent receptor n=1 Tax=Sandarakinorhabdus cyanobacteriorum TaxID=1981098 RepID=A0A255YPS7_9SPHN|nr:TonB-dependent receptor [Sandarakinorhabdus cyanobacteriorum]OYQ31208.1 TonB-dependent receptor [Sandarakinorhabdus cyanobacteriorum]
MRIVSGFRAGLVASASIIGMLAVPALAQQAAQAEDTGIEEIVVTAQRTAQSLQDVPIAVTAFDATALARLQINNPLDIQLTLPNITFTKGNFTGSSFTIRGIGDLCVGVTCDSATAIHSEGMPLFATRLFEAEFFDLERVEVLRGPQGTLFGRNATGGVVNFVNAKPKMDAIHAAGEIEYGNFDSLRLKGMFNLPISDTLAVRVAGTYLRRDGFTTNVFNNTRIDGRDLYAIRGSIRWQPTENTTVDAMAYYFRESDDRNRNQKQLCQTDPTGVLGCLPGRRDNGFINANSTFVGTLASREFLTTQGGAAFGALGLGSLYAPDPYNYAGHTNPADVRQIRTDYTPKYFAEEEQYMLRIQHDFGGIKAQLTGMYQRNAVDSSIDYNQSVFNPAVANSALATARAFSAAIPGLTNVVNAVSSGANFCTSQPVENGLGAYGGFRDCFSTPQDFDRSNQIVRGKTLEGIISSQWDGKFNFLIGGIYVDTVLPENSYYVNSWGIDYLVGVLGAANGGYLGTPFFRNNTARYTLKSYGLFGEAYYNLTDNLKITAGLRYNNDKKFVSARSTLASFFVPFGTTGSVFNSPAAAGFDGDPNRAGIQPFSNRNVSFSEVTGRFVMDWQITDDNLLYFSYSRGYKSGGINPPLQPIFAVPDTFTPEFIDAFEIGSKNSFLDGALRANVTAFYYKYKGLQLSRITARTSVNDNVDAEVYGLEGEFIIQPTRRLAVNLNASYLHTRVSTDKFLANPRNPAGNRSDAVIVKDISNGSNCAVVNNGAGGQAATRAFVAQANGAINAGLIPGLRAGAGLRAPTDFPADSGLPAGVGGAFSFCGVLQALGTGTQFQMLPEGVLQNLRGNQLPQAPQYKFSAGMQYTFPVGDDMSFIPRVDIAHTGESFGNIFNGAINRVPSFTVVNAQAQFNGKDDKWYVRAFVQNLTNNNAVTGLYVTDQSSGLFTNIFTLEPRRYGVAAGFRF